MDFKALKNLAYLTQLAFIMLTPILLGVYIGNFLDVKFGTSPLILLICIVLGVGTAFMNLYKFVMSVTKKDAPEKKEEYIPNSKSKDDR